MRSLQGLGQRIRTLRQERKLSQEALAAKAGIHRVSLTDIERGAAQPTLDTLERIARALGHRLRVDLVDRRR